MKDKGVKAVEYLTATDAGVCESASVKYWVEMMLKEYGDVVDCYPTWHPLVCNHNPKHPVTSPDQRCGYKGLDHVILLERAIIACPYGDGEDLIQSVKSMLPHDVAHLDVFKVKHHTLYSPDCTPIVITCNWKDGTLTDKKKIKQNVAIALMLKQELQCWSTDCFAEPWQTMKPSVCGVDNEGKTPLLTAPTVKAIKSVWNNITRNGVFGESKPTVHY